MTINYFGLTFSAIFRMIFGLYQLAWSIAIPFLRCNQRLRQGFDERVLKITPERADLWIQAVSVGEALLARELIKHLQFYRPICIFITTYTYQGMEILQKIKKEVNEKNSFITIRTAYFPFDKPSIMRKALACVRPKVMLLLESELWPGLLINCKENGVKIIVINGRMTAKSLSRYQIWTSFWQKLSPDLILAMSSDDGLRFSSLFGADKVGIMANIKFDRISKKEISSGQENPLLEIIPQDSKFIVLGSVRQEEEGEIIKIICHIKEKNNKIIIGLFPRHMHRIKKWQQLLTEHSISWELRSQSQVEIAPGCLVLWDTMGELTFAYGTARAAFVGGSLAPVGGQNFLEPLTCGLKPVIGPYWSNFFWIGQEIIDSKLVVQKKNWLDVAETIINQATVTPERESTKKAIVDYVEDRRGGSEQAGKAIINLFDSTS